MFKFVSKKAAKTILGSLMTILLCAALITESTLAIFISHHDVNIAVTSGNISVTATPSLTSAASKAWKDDAWVDESCLVKGNSATFSNGGKAYLEGGNVHLENITPGDSATVAISIQNKGTIDVKYQLQADFGENYALLDVLDFTMQRGGADQAMTFDVSAKWLSDWQTLATEASENIELKISFPIEDVDDWDACMGQKAEITLTVLAYQGNANVTNPAPPAADELAAGEAATITADDVGTYKILQAENRDGYDFLYWARQSAVRVLSASGNSFGTYVSNSQTYKFRVGQEDLGATYKPVYRRKTDGKKIVHLNVSSNSYTVTESDVGNEIELILQDELWYRFDHIEQKNKDGTQSTHQASHNENKEYIYRITSPSHADIGATYTAVYEEMTGEDYSNFNFDNSGAVDYYAEVVEENVERPKTVEEGAGDLKGENVLDDYPLYNKGYKQETRKRSDYLTLHHNAYEQMTALMNFGNTSYVAKDGNIWSTKQMTAEQASTKYSELLKSFCATHGIEYSPVIDVTYWGSGYDENSQEYIDFKEKYLELFNEYIREIMSSGGTIWEEVGHLYKHMAAENMYLGNVDDSAPAVTKKISATPRGTVRNMSPTITGLYAPAGEVITFRMSKEDMEKTGGMILTIGQVDMTGHVFTFDEKKSPPRPWRISCQTTIKNGQALPYDIETEDGMVTFYFGSFLGGPIYVSPVKAGTHFTIEISGAVQYKHFIYGYTTSEEWRSYQELSAPFFDLWTPGEDMRFCGPATYARDLSWTDLCKVSHFWSEMARISKRFPNETFGEYGIEFMFDTYISATGAAACAYPGSNTLDVPISWMRSSLDYDYIMENGGWGNFHEFNHCYQMFGIGQEVEVTNNAVSLAEISMLTGLSSKRTVTDSGEVGGLGGGYANGGWETGSWLSYTDPEMALRTTLNPKDGKQSLCKYVTLYYCFGLEKFIDAAWRSNQNGGWNRNAHKPVAYFEAACDSYGYNMEYYFKEILNLDISESTRLEEFRKLPMYVPVASTYQTGIGYACREDGKGVKIGEDAAGVMEYTTSSRPFRIPFDAPYTLDFERHLLLPEDFEFTISCSSQPQSGKIASVPENDKKFTYTPQPGATSSGRMIFTVTYYGKAGTAAADIEGIVEVVVELVRAPKKTETNVLERTTYTFAVESEEVKGEEGETAAIAEAAAEDPYQKALKAWKDCAKAKSTEIFGDAMYVESKENPVLGVEKTNNTTISFDATNVPSNSFVVVSGCFTLAWGNRATYEIGLEGRGEGALYTSSDGKTYTLLVSLSSPEQTTRVKNQLFIQQGNVLHFRLVLAVNEDPEAFLTIIFGTQNQSEDQLQYTDPLTNETNGVCLKTYRIIDEATTYELEYAESCEQTYCYDDKSSVKQTLVTEKSSLNGYPEESTLDKAGISSLDNLFDEDKSNFYVVSRISAGNPFALMVDMGQDGISANVAYLRAGAEHAPMSFRLYVGDVADQAQMTLVYEQDAENLAKRARIGKLSTAELPFITGTMTFRYYYLVITRVPFGNTQYYYPWLELCGIDFAVQWNLKQPDDTEVEKHGEWSMQKAKGSTFGHILECKAAKKDLFSSVSFTFSGQNILVTALAAAKYGAMEIYIDGKFAAAVDLRNFSAVQNGFTLEKDKVQRVFEKTGLDPGEHTITLRGMEPFNIDSFAYL